MWYSVPMSFGFRKAYSTGPFRMTLSKTGVSMSFGAGGARLATGPRGTHVSFSKGGFYYRTRLDAPPSAQQAPFKSPAPPEVPQEPVTPATSAGDVNTPTSAPTTFGDTTPDAVVEAINKRMWHLASTSERPPCGCSLMATSLLPGHALGMSEKASPSTRAPPIFGKKKPHRGTQSLLAIRGDM